MDGTVAFTLHGQQWELTTDDIGTEGARLRGSVGGAVNATIPAKSSIGGPDPRRRGRRERADRGCRPGRRDRKAREHERRSERRLHRQRARRRAFVRRPGPRDDRIRVTAQAGLAARASIADAAIVRGIDVRLGESSAQGEVEWSSGSNVLRGMIGASVAIADLGGLSATASRRLPLGGRLGVSASLSGTLVHPRATATANEPGLDVAGQHIDRAALDVSADLAASRFVVDRLTLQSGSGQIDGRGDIDLTRDTYVAHLTASDVPVGPLIGIGDSDVPISARLNGSFDGEGSFKNLGGRGRLSLAEARWKKLSSETSLPR